MNEERLFGITFVTLASLLVLITGITETLTKFVQTFGLIAIIFIAGIFLITHKINEPNDIPQ
jgi:uncharacterized membrane protein